MSSVALFIIHQVKPGNRDQIKEIWMKHMAPAIQDNVGHVAYFYTFDDNDPNSICAFQVYESADAAKAFLGHPGYQAYLLESRPLLAHEPKILSLSPQWMKRPVDCRLTISETTSSH